jgi:hypothetical protein
MWAVVLAIAAPRAAAAQTTQPLQLGVGYQVVHESVNGSGQTFPVGLYVDAERVVAADQMKSWSWMGQFDAAVHSESGLSEQIYTALGGIRLASTTHHRWVPSGFGLLGIGALNTACQLFCEGSATGFALQGGFVMTTRLNDSTLIDVAFKATKLKIEGEGFFNTAVAGGVRFNLTK